MITKAIISVLAGNDGVSAIVGTRIYPNVIKTDSQFPAIAVSADGMEKLSCDNAGGVRMGKIQIFVFASTYQKTHDAINAIRDALDDYAGTVGTVGLTVMSALETSDDYDETRNLHIKVIEYDACAQVK